MIARHFRMSILSILAIAVAGFPAISASAQTAEDLVEQVVIRRTEYGVPHILARSPKAMGFGLAYAQAEDHMEKIARLIITAKGELSKNFGYNDRNLESDFRQLQYRIPQRAQETYNYLDPEWRDVTEGYALGLNYYIEKHRADLPEWVQPVSQYDVAAHGLSGVARFALDRGGVVRKFLAKMEKGEDAIADEDESTGSNMWAFAPGRTQSGNAILMGNPHQPWSDVATYYEAHVTVPGVINFYGSTFIGRPVLTTGFNENLGWTHTVNYPDIEEIYAIPRDPSDSKSFILDGKSQPMTTEIASVEFYEDGELLKENRLFWYTPMGPVVYKDREFVYVHRPVAYFDFRYYSQWYRLGKAREFGEWRAIFDELVMPMFNTGYADREGNIYYLWTGAIPKLPLGSHADEAVPVTTSDEIWTQVHTIDELPQLFNPKGGYIMNSNSAPYHTNLNEVLDPAHYPDYFPKPRYSLRSQHSTALIHNDTKFSLEDVVKLKFDERSFTAERIKDDLLAALNSAELNADEKLGVEVLTAWDDTTARESRGGVLFQVWLNHYRKGGSAEDKLFATVWDFDNPMTTPDGLANPARAVEAYKVAVAEVLEKHGALDVPWGDVHRLRFGDNVDLPLGGADNDMGSFRIIRYREADDNKRVAYSGDSWVFAVEFGEEQPKAYSVVAYSESSREDSPNFADQAALFADEKMKRVAFTEDEIEAALVKSYRPGEE